MAQQVKNPPANAGDIRDVSSIPGSGRSPGIGHGNPLQYSCLENPKDRGAWWATVHGVTKESNMTEQLRAHTHPYVHSFGGVGFFPVLDPALEAELEAGILVQFVEGTLWDFPHSSVGKESACSAEDPGSIPELGRSAGEAIGYPLQYSGLENSMDCIVPGVTKSWIRLNDFHFNLF